MALELSRAEITMLTETWAVPAANIFESGDEILFRFFERHPQYMSYFRRFKGAALSDLRGKAVFRSHASRILNRFAATVDALQFGKEGLEEIGEMWREVGEFHSKFQVPPQSFKDLEEIVLEVLTGACQLTSEQRATWRRLIDFIYELAFETMGSHSSPN